MPRRHTKNADQILGKLNKLLEYSKSKQQKKINGKTYKELKNWRDGNGDNILHHWFGKQAENTQDNQTTNLSPVSSALIIEMGNEMNNNNSPKESKDTRYNIIYLLKGLLTY